MVDSGRKKTFIDKLLFVLKPKKSRTDIVDYAEKIIDDYTGCTAGRVRRRKRHRKLIISLVLPTAALFVMYILSYTLKIFL